MCSKVPPDSIYLDKKCYISRAENIVVTYCGHSIALHFIFLVYNFHLKIGVDLQTSWIVFQEVNPYIDDLG